MSLGGGVWGLLGHRDIGNAGDQVLVHEHTQGTHPEMSGVQGHREVWGAGALILGYGGMWGSGASGPRHRDTWVSCHMEDIGPLAWLDTAMGTRAQCQAVAFSGRHLESRGLPSQSFPHLSPDPSVPLSSPSHPLQLSLLFLSCFFSACASCRACGSPCCPFCYLLALSLTFWGSAARPASPDAC